MSSEARSRISQGVRNAHAWAGKQLSKASQLVRSFSLASSTQPADIYEQVQASDGYFFEQLQPPQLPSPLKLKFTEADIHSAAIENLSLNDDEKDLEDLYVEALYTIVHKVGRSSGAPDASLIDYVQRAFSIDNNRHEILLRKAHKEKPPVVLLNVILLEARDLIAKDINGFSDPFSMLGVIPSDRRKAASPTELCPPTEAAFELCESNNNGYDDSMNCQSVRSPTIDKQKQLGGILQRFGGSFRRKVGNRKAKKETDAIPAKLIKASSVQKKTLNPKWYEKFQFIVDDVNADRFHMDIWDHDDEEQSVMDAVTSLNQISGLKGLGRYFKEVTQSARADSEECTDDFLGCITLKIKDIPSTGIEDWFTLEKRSERSEVSGQVRLKLWLSTKEERNETDDEELIDVRQHIQLIRKFTFYEINQSGAPASNFQGSFPAAANTLLHQHAIQGDLYELHQAMCAWIAYSSLVNIGISYAFLFDIYTNLISKWTPLILDKDQENMLGDSLIAFDRHCKTAIIEHRTRFLASARSSVDSFSNLLRCTKLVHESAIFDKCVPFQRQFPSTVSSQISLSAELYFKKALEVAKNEDPCTEFYSILLLINQACSTLNTYNVPFKTFAKVDYAQLTFQQFDRMLEEYLCSEMMSESSSDLKSLLIDAYKQEKDDGKSLTTLLKLHFALNEFRSYQVPKLSVDTDSDELSFIFDKAICKWIDMVRVRAFARVDLSCQLDSPIETCNDVKHTSSYVDICHMIEQIITAWERMRVSDIGLRVELTGKIVQNICKIAEYYVDRILAQLATEGFCGELLIFIPAAMLLMFCAAINNAEQVRRCLMLHSKLHLDDISAIYSKLLHCDQHWRNDVERNLDECDRYISDQITATIDRLVRRLKAQIKKHVFHLAWSPSACPIETAIKPLIDMLDDELNKVHRILLHKNFTRVMLCQLKAILPLLQECIDENSGMDPIFYRRLNDACSTLVEFFHANGKGVSMETLERISDYQKLRSILMLNQTPTVKLIEQYYKDLLKEQNDVSECKYGILNIRAYYNLNSKTLVIDVIGAKQVIPLDSNGLSDPFVIIELVPRIFYANQSVVKTRVVSKSLNPIFDETFEFHIENKIAPGAMVHFIVMDHDFLRSNDYAGEAFLELCDIPGFSSSAGSTLRQFNLILIHPNQKENASIAVLSSRKDDKNAQDFVRSLNTVY